MLPLANKVTHAHAPASCNFSAMQRYTRNKITRLRGIGSTGELLRSLPAETSCRFKLSYHDAGAIPMMHCGFISATSPSFTAPNRLDAVQRIKRSRDNSMTGPIEARGSKSVSQVKP
jgi:hypothetical protein